MLRKTINLTTADLDVLSTFLDRSSLDRQSLGELADEKVDSESDVLRALVGLGIRAVLEHQLDVGYALLAESRDDEDEAWTNASVKWAAEVWGDDA